MFRHVCYFFTLLAATAAFGGCGGGGEEWSAERPQPFPATGTVLYNQKPVEGATVVLHPEGKTKAATAQTDANGKFQLQTYKPNDGAIPGQYKVTIQKVEVASAGAEEESNVNASAAPKENWLIPKKYGSAESSGLTATVSQEGNDFTFELVD